MISEASERPSYFRKTNNLLYSYLFSIPLLLLYEILIIVSQPGGESGVRISVDVWFKSMFMVTGYNPLHITLLLAFAAGMVILYQHKKQISSIKGSYFFYMLAESFAYAVVTAFLISIFLGSLLQLISNAPESGFSFLQMLALSLGAGLYEELFFRVILISMLFLLFKQFTKSKNSAYFISAIVAAVLFSSVHYIGDFGDLFTIESFLFRFLFGLALNAIYVLRGFGVAAWTHAIYDILVLLNHN